ncbi:MAG: ribosome silencing factor [bacterium]|nr:ribosome silencing factor [bacterium]
MTLEEKTRLCALAADSRKAEEIVVLNVQPLSSVADHFMICHGNSDRQVKAIADAIVEEIKKGGERPLATEGYREATWVLIDCADLVIHIFDEQTRQFYDLEHLWEQAEYVDISDSVTSVSSPPSTSLLVEEGIE